MNVNCQAVAVSLWDSLRLLSRVTEKAVNGYTVHSLDHWGISL